MTVRAAGAALTAAACAVLFAALPQAGAGAAAPPSAVPSPAAAGATPTPVPWPSVAPTVEPSGQPTGGVPSGAPRPEPSAIVSSRPSADRFHLHRPGTDVDGDSLNGSLASDVFVLKGNVVLHSDPKIDREIAEASESTQPLTVTADEIDVDRLSLSYVAKGHVHFTQGTRSGRADLAMLDEEKHTLDLVGNANVYDGDHRAAAAKMHYDMLQKDFAGSGNVRIYEPVPTPNPKASGTPAPKRKRRLPL